MTTAIEWTDATWNPTTGCDQVSPGCGLARWAGDDPHGTCYALTMAKRLKGMGSAKYQLDGDPRTSGPGFGITEHPDVVDEPLRWRKPRRVFVNSMSDLFHDGVSDGFIARVWAVMAATPQHTYQVLTKRHGRMRSLLNSERFSDYVYEAWRRLRVEEGRPPGWGLDLPTRLPLPNVWLGVSVEDQKRADLRVPALLDTPAAVRFLSCEPLLGAVDLTSWTQCRHDSETADEGPVEDLGRMPRRWRCDHCSSVRSEITTGSDDGVTGCRVPGLHWVIVGGESGPGARPMHPSWATRIGRDCLDAGVPFFFKQWGDWSPMAPLDGQGRFDWSGAHSLADDGTLYEPGALAWPDGPRVGEAIRANHGRAHLTHVYRVGKKAAGRELDGRTWDDFPRSLP